MNALVMPVRAMRVGLLLHGCSIQTRLRALYRMVDTSRCYPEGCRFESYPRSSNPAALAESPASAGNTRNQSTAPYVPGGARRAWSVLQRCSIQESS